MDKNCIYISIHVNAAGNGSKWMNATGWSAYTSIGKTAADKLADCLYDAAKKNLNGKNCFMNYSMKCRNCRAAYFMQL